MSHSSRYRQKSVASLSFACALLFCITYPLAAQDQDWEKKAETRSKELERKNGEGTDQVLKSELLKMRDTDQDIRRRYIDGSEDKRKALAAEMELIDKTLTDRLKEMVATKGWPTIHMVGIKASGAAALILIHSPDHKFQTKMLPQLQKLVDHDQIVGSDIALITDKLLVADGKPQRFGTQFGERDGKMVMSPVEDPDHLEQRREKYLLPPMAEYKKMLADMYHMPVE